MGGSRFSKNEWNAPWAALSTWRCSSVVNLASLALHLRTVRIHGFHLLIPFLWDFNWLLSIIRRFGRWEGGKSKSQLKSWVKAGKGFSGFPKVLETLWFSAVDWQNWRGLFRDLHQLSDKLYWTTCFSSLGWVWHLLPQLFQWCVGPQLLYPAPNPWNSWSCFSFVLWGIHRMS